MYFVSLKISLKSPFLPKIVFIAATDGTIFGGRNTLKAACIDTDAKKKHSVVSSKPRHIVDESEFLLNLPVPQILFALVPISSLAWVRYQSASPLDTEVFCWLRLT